MATVAEKLAEAQAAYHALIIGTQALVYVDQNGERIEYTRASAPLLASYIADLQRQIAGQSRPAVIHFKTCKGT